MLSIIALALPGFIVTGAPARATALSTVRMSDACVEVQRTPLGAKYACDQPQGLGSEQELVSGQPKWMKYPQMPWATKADLKKAGAKLIGTEGLAQIWASKTRPANGINCEEVWHNGELVWGCRVA